MLQLDAFPQHEIIAEEVDAGGNGRMTDPGSILRFVLAGKSRFTLVSVASGQRFTYRIKASSDGQVHFVSLLNGPDNETQYAYFGYIRRGVFFHGGAKAKVSADAPSAKGFAWFYKLLSQTAGNANLDPRIEFWHEGRCGRCGRALTVPESVASGFGPECAGRIGL